jgi:hypothetical protein
MTEQETKKQEQTEPECQKINVSVKVLRKLLVEVSNDVSNGLTLTNMEWWLFYRLQHVLSYFPDPQTRNITDDEAESIIGLRGHNGFSIGDLAFIFQRSKASIFECLKKHGVKVEPEESESQRVPLSNIDPPNKVPT